MTATVDVASWTDRDAWTRFVAASPQGSVFCHPALLDAQAVAWEVIRVGDGDEPTIAAVLLTDGAGEPAAAPQPFSQYQGLLCAPSLEEQPAHRRVRQTLEAVSALLEGLRDRRGVSWCLHPSFPDLRALQWFNYHDPAGGRFSVQTRYTGVLNLAPGTTIDAILAASRSVRRQEYRKARDQFVVAGSENLDLLDSLHDATFRRQGLTRPPGDAERLRRLAQAALASRLGELFIAYDRSGQPASAVLVLFDHRVASYLVAATEPAFRSSGVSTLLFLTAVERALARGLRGLDVVGMNSPGRSDFKASFGVELRPYWVVDWRRP